MIIKQIFEQIVEQTHYVERLYLSDKQIISSGRPIDTEKRTASRNGGVLSEPLFSCRRRTSVDGAVRGEGGEEPEEGRVERGKEGGSPQIGRKS